MLPDNATPEQIMENIRETVELMEYENSDGTKLKLIQPSDKVKDFSYGNLRGGIKVKLAKFGRFQTGVSFNAPVFVPENNPTGCKDFLSQVDKDDADLYDLFMNGFVLLEDGECTWETKARNVQRMGAQAALIATDDDEIVDSRETHFSDSKYDGTGHMIDIPTLLIDNDDGQKLLDTYYEARDNNDEQLVLWTKIDIVSKMRQTISYSLYYGSILDLDHDEILKWYNKQHPLMDSVFFIPRIFTFECLECPKEVRDKYCVSEGHFCF